jgi:hypothetical protein
MIAWPSTSTLQCTNRHSKTNTIKEEIVLIVKRLPTNALSPVRFPLRGVQLRGDIGIMQCLDIALHGNVRRRPIHMQDTVGGQVIAFQIVDSVGIVGDAGSIVACGEGGVAEGFEFRTAGQHDGGIDRLRGFTAATGGPDIVIIVLLVGGGGF